MPLALVVGIVAVGAIGSRPEPVSADPGDPYPSITASTQITIPGGPGTPEPPPGGGDGGGGFGDGGSGGITCHYEPAVGVPVPEPAAPPAEWRLLVCTTLDGEEVSRSLIYWTPGMVPGEAPPPGAPPQADAIDPRVLAWQAAQELPLWYPDPRAAPPLDGESLTGVPTWLWVPESQWGTRSATARVPGLTATVTAEPARTEWDLGDGAAVVCDGPGVPWHAGLPESATYCSHTYERTSATEPGNAYTATVTIVWSVTWTASNGDGGDFGEFSRTTQFPVAVAEAQALND
ncbi:MAG TPA: hypothetical protein VGB14_05055 [Acidimicrobiales bacterium]